jgi:hypothetical protein
VRQFCHPRPGLLTILPNLLLGLLLAVLGPATLAAAAAGRADPGTGGASTVRTWVRLHDVVFLSLQTDLKTLSADDGNGSTSAITAACQQLEVDLTTINRVPPIPSATAERHWKVALSDFRQGAADCVQGILRSSQGMLSKSGPLLRSGVVQVNDVLATLKRFDNR